MVTFLYMVACFNCVPPIPHPFLISLGFLIRHYKRHVL